MNYNLYFEFSAIIILATLTIALVLRKVSKGRNNVLFILMICSEFFTAVVDVLDIYSGNISIRYLLNYMYFIVRNISPLLYVMYVISVTGIWHRLKPSKPLGMLTFGPYILDIILIALNPVTKGIFYIDEKSDYYRGPLIYILYIVAFYYMILSLVILIRNRRLVEKNKFVILAFFQPINALAVFAQLYFPLFHIEIFGTTILTVLMAVGVHRPEEYTDSVVGIYSGGGFIKDIRKALDAGRPVAIILFKFTNHLMLRQNIGYELYTRLTCKLADKLKAVNELTDSKADLYYLDKGSFAAVASYSRYNMIYNFGRMLADYVKSPIKLGIMEVELDARVCLVTCPNDIKDADSLINFVNEIQYRIPDNRELINLADVSESREFKMRNDMNAIISRGISGHNFQMYYQPIYSVKEKRFTSAEALIRLIDEEYGFVSPALFIPVAEETGAIHHIGDYVIDEVCRFISGDVYKTLNLDYIEINLSVAQCIEADLPDKFGAVLAKYGIRPSQINLEITETSVDYNPEVTDHNIGELCDRGFNFSLDDYGTGYSNIRRVVTLPLSIVKLDKCLVDDMDNESMWIVIKNTVNMLKHMNKKILVEGVETKEAFDRFSLLGCDYIQGFYFSKPLPEREFIRFIRRMEEKREDE